MAAELAGEVRAVFLRWLVRVCVSMTSDNRTPNYEDSVMTVYLETSSYLPLVWRTPYSPSLVGLMAERYGKHDFVIQRDCIKEASGYLSFKDDWRYHPAVRFRRLAERLSTDELRRLPFPSTAIQLLLGGNIWPQAQYLNFVRHTAFFFIDLFDNLSFADPRDGLEEAARRIEKRVIEYRALFEEHLNASTLRLPGPRFLSYWGSWYLLESPDPFSITVVDDPRPYNMTADKLRDIYHYDCAVSAVPRPAEMVVANTGFTRNVRTSFVSLPVPIICAEVVSTKLFGG